MELYKVSFNQILATDILFAKAHYAKSIQAVKPILNENKLLQLVTAFHPLLINKFQNWINFSANEHSDWMKPKNSFFDFRVQMLAAKLLF